MDQQVATQTLREIDDLRRRTRSVLRASWYPMVLFGAITMVSAVPVEIWSDAALGWYWPAASIGGSLLTARHYSRHQLAQGVVTNGLPYMLTAAGIIIGACLAGALGHGDVRLVGPWLAVACGYAVFGYLDRSLVFASFGLAAALWALVVAATDPAHAYTVLALPLGAAGVAVGLASRYRPELG